MNSNSMIGVREVNRHQEIITTNERHNGGESIHTEGQLPDEQIKNSQIKNDPKLARRAFRNRKDV